MSKALSEPQVHFSNIEMPQYRRIIIQTRTPLTGAPNRRLLRRPKKVTRICAESYHLNADSELLPNNPSQGEPSVSVSAQRELLGFSDNFPELYIFVGFQELYWNA